MKAISTAFVATVMVSFVFFGCSQNHKEREADNRIMEEQAPASVHEGSKEPKATMASSAAVNNEKDSIHQFIRTADVKFKVKNVATATYQIEDITRQLGGYVSYTTLTSAVKDQHVIAVSADSSLQTTTYDVQNTMTIRVPNTQLDSALKCLAPLVAYLDYRLIKANDAGLQLLANRLKQTRIARHEDRMNHLIDARGKKLTETADAQESLLNRQEQSDNAQIDNLALNDQVKFSTINLSLYQPETVQRELVCNDKNLTPFEPALRVKLLESAQFGWSLFEALIVFVVRLWPVMFIAFAAAVGYRKWRKVALKAVS